MKIFPMTFVMLSVAAIFQTNAFAQTDIPRNDSTTGALVQVCKNISDRDAQNFCFGFGEGVYQAYLAYRNPKLKPSVCFPSENETRESILQKFLAWNQVNTQFNQEQAAKTLVRFFETQYPCK